jgi:hypothetical protein
MYLPEARRSNAILLDYYGEYVIVRLSAEKQAAHARSAFETAHDVLREAGMALRKARHELSGAIARRRRTEQDLHGVVSSFDLAILMEVGRKRRHASYRRYSPCTLRAFATTGIEKRIEKVKAAELGLARADTPPSLAQ